MYDMHILRSVGEVQRPMHLLCEGGTDVHRWRSRLHPNATRLYEPRCSCCASYELLDLFVAGFSLLLLDQLDLEIEVCVQGLGLAHCGPRRGLIRAQRELLTICSALDLTSWPNSVVSRVSIWSGRHVSCAKQCTILVRVGCVATRELLLGTRGCKVGVRGGHLRGLRTCCRSSKCSGGWAVASHCSGALF